MYCFHPFLHFVFLPFVELTDPQHLPVHIFNCTDNDVDYIVAAAPPAPAILWVLCWGRVLPHLPAGFSYQHTVVVSTHSDANVVLLWAASNAHTSDTLNVCFCFSSLIVEALFHVFL